MRKEIKRLGALYLFLEVEIYRNAPFRFGSQAAISLNTEREYLPFITISKNRFLYFYYAKSILVCESASWDVRNALK